MHAPGTGIIKDNYAIHLLFAFGATLLRNAWQFTGDLQRASTVGVAIPHRRPRSYRYILDKSRHAQPRLVSRGKTRRAVVFRNSFLGTFPRWNVELRTRPDNASIGTPLLSPLSPRTEGKLVECASKRKERKRKKRKWKKNFVRR